jgi:hypothetical protein
MTSKIGKNVDSWCTHCRLVLAHTIEIMAGERITRVCCNTCGGQHLYRVAAPRARAAPPSTRAATGRAASSRRVGRTNKEQAGRASEYEEVLRGRTASTARLYSTSARFKVGELLSHPTFGLGAITGERDNVKLDVVFADGPRVLLHGHNQASSRSDDEQAVTT